jgi:methylmalonyl-CoA mutase N-terminal domain/subunit
VAPGVDLRVPHPRGRQRPRPRSSPSPSPTASAYVQSAIDRGLDVDSFAPRLSFFFDVHIDFFEEIAKFRAARRIWARTMRERFGAKNPESWKLKTHAQTAGVSLTAQQPYNNVARVALQALAAVLGGTQSLHTNSLDETYALPTEEAVTIALRTQQIVAHETGVAGTIDPLGGSYFVEWLTNKIEAEAMDYIRRIDEMGGMVDAVEKGYPQREIASAAYRFQRQVERNEKVVVGVNEFVMERPRAFPSCASTRPYSASRPRASPPSRPAATAPRSPLRCRGARDGSGGHRQPLPAHHRGRQGLLHRAGGLRRAPRVFGTPHRPGRVLGRRCRRRGGRGPSGGWGAPWRVATPSGG